MAKFIELLVQRNPIISTVYSTSRICPRHKRIALIYFAFLLNLLANSVIFIRDKLGNALFLNACFCSGVSWMIFILLVLFSSISKQKLKSSTTTDEFRRAIQEIEKEALYKNVIVHIWVIVFGVFSACQYLLLFSGYPNDKILTWILLTIVGFIFQFAIIDALWILFLAYMRVKAYESRRMKRIYRLLNKTRIWRL